MDITPHPTHITPDFQVKKVKSDRNTCSSRPSASRSHLSRVRVFVVTSPDGLCCIYRSKTVTELQKRLPELQTELRGLVAQEAERVKKEERSVPTRPAGNREMPVTSVHNLFSEVLGWLEVSSVICE